MTGKKYIFEAIGGSCTVEANDEHEARNKLCVAHDKAKDAGWNLPLLYDFELVYIEEEVQ